MASMSMWNTIEVHGWKGTKEEFETFLHGAPPTDDEEHGIDWSNDLNTGEEDADLDDFNSERMTFSCWSAWQSQAWNGFANAIADHVERVEFTEEWNGDDGPSTEVSVWVEGEYRPDLTKVTELVPKNLRQMLVEAAEAADAFDIALEGVSRDAETEAGCEMRDALRTLVEALR